MAEKKKTTVVKATVEAPKDVAPKDADAPKKTRMYVSAEDFIRAYKAGETYEDVAQMLGQSVTTVQQRVYNYKKKGINIEAKPGKGRGAAKLDVEKINKMLAAE